MKEAIELLQEKTVEEETSKSTRFFKLYNSVHTRIYSFLLIIVHNQDDTEELLQETASLMWEQFDQFQEGTNFGAWAIAIARNKALEFLRKNKKTRMVFDDIFYDQVSKHAEQSSHDVSDRSQALRLCLEKLQDKDKKLLFMRYRKNVSVKRISQVTGRSLNGLYQSFSRIIMSLRLCISRHLARQEI